MMILNLHNTQVACGTDAVGHPLESSPKDKAPIFLHPKTPVHSAQATLLTTMEENVSLCLNPLSSFLLTYGHEIPD